MSLTSSAYNESQSLSQQELSDIMFASVRNTQLVDQKVHLKEQTKMFESGGQDSYQACGTFGFTKKDFKLSQEFNESAESSTDAPKQSAWKSVQVTKLDLNQIENECSQTI